MRKLRKMRVLRGFTLIELMIVIAIIGILAAIAIPNFTKARRKAKQKACIANLRTMESALEMYLMENASTEKPALDVLGPYMQGENIPKCPTTDSTEDYSIIGSNTSGFYVKCSIHGTTYHPADVTN